MGEAFLTALEKGREDVRADSTIDYDHIPAVYVSRTGIALYRLFLPSPQHVGEGPGVRGLYHTLTVV
jgi:hypothetical protein